MSRLTAIALAGALACLVAVPQAEAGWRHHPYPPAPAWHTYRGDCMPRYGFYDRPGHWYMPAHCLQVPCYSHPHRLYYPGWGRGPW